MPRASLVLFVALFYAVTGCRPGDPPVAPDVDAAVSPLPAPGQTARSPVDAGSGPAAAASPDSSGTTASGAVVAASSPTSTATPADAGPDPGTLPQTKDKPSGSGAAFDARVGALWDGIVHDDPDRAMPFFFPVTAYEQVKAIATPASDWRRRLVANYKRDIHGLHKRLGEHAADAKLVRADVPDDRARWVDPGEESNKLGYFRVYGTRLVYELDGKEHAFDVSSLISWRGEWYVVHLTGFK